MVKINANLTGRVKKDFKAVEVMLRELPKPDYENLCDFIGFTRPEVRILDLKYRSGEGALKPTREYIAEEVGMSPSTLDRRCKSMLKRIAKYADRILAQLAWTNVGAPKL